MSCHGFCAFFFFKQKTAYEMRISDWSSDVCSSDLHGSCKAVLITDSAAPVRLPAGQQLECRFPRQDRPTAPVQQQLQRDPGHAPVGRDERPDPEQLAISDCGVDERMDTGPELRPHIIAPLLERPADAGRRHVCGAARRRRKGSGAQRPERRSEEHTSELQSLMRISYAVFCL